MGFEDESGTFAQKRNKALLTILAAAFLIAAPLVRNISADFSFGGHQADLGDSCAGGTLTPMAMPPIGAVNDLEITGDCTVPAGSYYYGKVNIYQKPDTQTGGNLTFNDATINFWANSILVEKGGTLRAGITKTGVFQPIGTNGGTLTIYLWGAEAKNPSSGAGIECKLGPMCGVDKTVWDSNLNNTNPKKCDPSTLTGGVKDCFYAYHPLNFDDAVKTAYFGYKVLAVSYGGSLQLFGAKGASYSPTIDTNPANSGSSWVRLAANLPGATTTHPTGETELTLDRGVTTWKKGERIVVSSTDYMPAHAEIFTIADDVSGTTVKLMTNVQYAHNGTKFPLSRIPDHLGIDPTLVANGIEIRAGVALLSRSIRIVSGGSGPCVFFPDLPSTYSFGGHTILRQGFKTYKLQEVEFSLLGEGETRDD